MNYIRRFLFIIFGLDRYLRIIRTAYFPIFKTGLLRRNQVYDWHYFVKNLIRKGDVIIDIGANMGYYSFIFSRLVGNSGKVYSVEPVPPLVKQLRKQLMRQKNVRILPFALGDKKGKVLLSMPKEFPDKGYPHHGLFSIREDHTFTSDKFVFHSTQCKGSEVFADVDRIDYIKCDVEGYEKIILEDMKPLLIKLQPMVQVEIRDKNFLPLLNFFKRLGYKAYKLKDGTLIKLEDLSLHQQHYFDTLFVPPRHFVRIRPFINENPADRCLSQPIKQSDLQTNP